MITDTPHSVGLLWMSDQREADTQPHDTHKRQTYVLPVGSNPQSWESALLRNQALDGAATGIEYYYYYYYYYDYYYYCCCCCCCCCCYYYY
jgi:hypothetical protein